ncbi:MAG TPA: peptidylprolyl isomerase [Candidatus Doudnabacteria bacterium]|nr:peptidylprolyl isomerase [Candidatus Doudnabacteria bacterium]
MNNKIIFGIIAILVVVTAAWLLMRTNSRTTNNQTMNTNENQTQTETPVLEPVSGETVLIDVQDFGTITVALNSSAAPQTTANFLKLVNDQFYNGLTFHRIAAGFVIQGGDPSGDGTGGPGYTVPAEIGLAHKKGAIAMARLGDQVNPERASSGSQFYIALEDLPMLDGQYTVFGQVISGMDVVEKIGAVPIQGAGDGPPQTPVVIKSITIIE